MLALAFDSLISVATHRLNGSSIAAGLPPAKVTEADVTFVTVRPHTKKRWAAFRSTPAKALLVEQDEATAFARATAQAKSAGMCVVSHDYSGRATRWSTLLD